MTFESGVEEGEKLIRLLRSVAIAWKDLPGFDKIRFGCTEKQMAYYWGNFPKHKPTDAMTGFLRTIIPDRFADYGVIKLMPFDETASFNDDFAPLCNFSKDLGFAGFAYWTGDSDGDAWVFDLNNGSICSINVGEYREAYAEISERAYAKARSLAEWRGFLIKKAIDREWLAADALSELA